MRGENTIFLGRKTQNTLLLTGTLRGRSTAASVHRIYLDKEFVRPKIIFSTKNDFLEQKLFFRPKIIFSNKNYFFDQK